MLESDCFRRSEVGTFLMGHGNLKPFTSTYLIDGVESSICSSFQLSCSRSFLTWLSCSKYSLGHLLVTVQYSSGSAVFSMISVALSFFLSFFFGTPAAAQLGGEICGRLEGGCSRVREEECSASCSSCPRFRFREEVDGLWRICGRGVASITLAPRDGERSNEGIYFSALKDIACWRGKRCLHFLRVIAFG